MRELVAIVTGLAALSIPGSGHARFGPPPPGDKGQAAEIARLTKELYRAKLGRIALLTDHCSEGDSRLKIGLGASGEPVVGGTTRVHSWDGVPVITVYPLSSPTNAKLPDIGDCELLGAVALGFSATTAEDDGKDARTVAKPDVYLLAYGMGGRWLGEARLVSVAVDDEGRVKLDEALRTVADHSERDIEAVADAVWPMVTVEFPDEGEVSDDAPAWRAHVCLMWAGHVYEFRLDLRIVTE